MNTNDEKAIRVVACPKPFSTVRVERSLAAGKNLAEILGDLGISVDAATDAVVMIGDATIKPKYWQYMRPKPGSVVTVRACPRGNHGKSFLRVIIGITGALAGLFTGGAAAGAIWGAGAAATGGVIGQAAGGLVGFVIGGSK